MIDCRRYPSDNNCQVTILGRHDEVMELAVWHDVTAHGHLDGPNLRATIENDMVEVDEASTI
jgi:hypothetical protein